MLFLIMYNNSTLLEMIFMREKDKKFKQQY